MNYYDLMTQFLNKCEANDNNKMRTVTRSIFSIVYEYRQCKLDFGRQTYKSTQISEFALEQKLRNPHRDIFIIGHTALDTKLKYNGHVEKIGIKPIKSVEFIKASRRALSNPSWQNHFRGRCLNSPIFIIEEPMGLNTFDFIDALTSTIAFTGYYPIIYFIGC